MINTVNASLATPGGSAEKLDALSYKAGALREQLLHAKQAGAPSGDGGQTDTITQQLLGINAQIDRLALEMQLSRLGDGADLSDANGDGSHAGAALAASQRGDAGAKPAGSAAKHHAGGDPYRPAKTPGKLVNLSS